jgi:DNA invertase Pin-like site-specific DNA recombinase
MAIIGYARVSSVGQSLDVQLEQLEAGGCEKVFSEKITGTTTKGRSQLALALDYVREGDVLVVTRMDRLSRSLTDLRLTVDQLTAKGVGFRALQQSGIDTTRPEGKLMLAMLGAFAEFETDIRKERQLEGIAKAKAANVYKGRKPSVPVADVRRLAAEGVGATEIGKRLGIGRASVYRALAEADD